jgi:hypothetical protein
VPGQVERLQICLARRVDLGQWSANCHDPAGRVNGAFWVPASPNIVLARRIRRTIPPRMAAKATCVRVPHVPCSSLPAKHLLHLAGGCGLACPGRRERGQRQKKRPCFAVDEVWLRRVH